MSSKRILLVSPPWRSPSDGNLALATLKPILESAGFEVDLLHGSLMMPPCSDTTARVMPAYGAMFFGPYLEAATTGVMPDLAPYVDGFVARWLQTENLEGLVVPGARSTEDLGCAEELLRGTAREAITLCGQAMDRMEAAVLAAQHDAIGLSTTFESQLPAGLALARRIRRARPHLPMVLGGAACFAELGHGLARAFPELTAVCHCEADGMVEALFSAVIDGTPLSTVPGIAWLDRSGILQTTPAPPPTTAMDDLPVPDYRDFVGALAASDWARPARLFFETSRGCWWGQKTLCTFCGLNAEGLAFRSKSPERAVEEIRALYRDYPTAERFFATDNIMEMSYFDQVLPEIADLAADPERPLKLFYEVKPNLRKSQVRALRDAGVDVLQPGIESYSDGVLSVMRKGNTALGQLQFVKWAVEQDIWPVYNLLVRNPGEAVAHYEDMLALIDSITHLPPPTIISTTWLERFSPYFMQPQAHGIGNIRARAHYRFMYPDASVPLDDLAYVFDYDHPIIADPAFVDVHHRFVRRVGLWQYYWRPAQLFFRHDGTAIHIVDRRGDAEKQHLLTDAFAAVFRALDRVRGEDALQREFPQADVAGIVNFLVDSRFACRDARGRALVIVPEIPRSAAQGLQEAATAEQAMHG